MDQDPTGNQGRLKRDSACFLAKENYVILNYLNCMQRSVNRGQILADLHLCIGSV